MSSCSRFVQAAWFAAALAAAVSFGNPSAVFAAGTVQPTPSKDVAEPPHAMPPYDQLGLDTGDVVTLPEVEVHNPELARRIAHCDTNGDKQLSRAEYRACKPLRAARHHAQVTK